MSLEDKAKTLYYLREKSVKYEPYQKSTDIMDICPELKEKWLRLVDAQKEISERRLFYEKKIEDLEKIIHSMHKHNNEYEEEIKKLKKYLKVDAKKLEEYESTILELRTQHKEAVNCSMARADEIVKFRLIMKNVRDHIKNFPEPRLVTDYTHYAEEDYKGEEHPPAPKYWIIPDNKKWLKWFEKLVEIAGSENKPRTSPLRKDTEASGGGEDVGDNRKVSLSLIREPSDEPEKYIVHVIDEEETK